jgi:hypothetical protein
LAPLKTGAFDTQLGWQVIDPACDRVGVLDAEPRRDFLFVDDLVELVIRLSTTSIKAC